MPVIQVWVTGETYFLWKKCWEEKQKSSHPNLQWRTITAYIVDIHIIFQFDDFDASGGIFQSPLDEDMRIATWDT